MSSLSASTSTADPESDSDCNLNADSLESYLLLFDDQNEEENMAKILRIADRYLSESAETKWPSHKLDGFRKLRRFALSMGHHDDDDQHELNQNDDDDDDQQTAGPSTKSDAESLKSAQSSLSMEIDAASHRVVVHSLNVRRCTVSFYGMNTELLFSINPFAFSSPSAAASTSRLRREDNATNYISPQMVTAVELEDGDGDAASTTVPIPDGLRNQNVFIRVDSCDDDEDAVNPVSDGDTFYDHQLVLRLKERYGRIQVLSKERRQPIQRAYCKVFAKMSSGLTEFYKDGYTDIRGQFDYVSVSSGKLKNALKFAMLIVTDRHGSAIKFAKPPRQ